MPHCSISALLVVAAVAQVCHTLPVSPSHRYAVYTPYWQQHSQPYVPTHFVKKQIKCTAELCDTGPAPDAWNDQPNVIPLIKTTKRNRNVYKTDWTMGGMPFSVLYMNSKPQISVRSPVAEPLRAVPQIYDNSELLVREPPPVQDKFDEYVQEVQAQALTSGLQRSKPTLAPTRRQYSVIPQLFVSYGWGPLGK